MAPTDVFASASQSRARKSTELMKHSCIAQHMSLKPGTLWSALRGHPNPSFSWVTEQCEHAYSSLRVEPAIPICQFSRQAPA